MNMRVALSLSVLFSAACGTDPDPMAIAGDWVLTFPTLSVTAGGVQCASSSGSLLRVEQDGNQIAATFAQGLLFCSATSTDSIAVPFAQGSASGTVSGDRLDLQFETGAGSLTGTVQGSSASGTVEFTDATYNVTVAGAWLAERRTPSGAIKVTIHSGSLSGQSLPPVLLTLDGNTAIQLPENGTLLLGELAGGRHLITLATGGAQSCTIGGGPSGSLTGMNPNTQFIDIIESDAPREIVYDIGCA